MPNLEFLKRFTVQGYIALVFSTLVAIAFLVSLGAMVYFKYTNPNADIGLWLNVFLTCLGYMIGILTGILGIPPVQPPPAGGSHS